MKKTLLFLISAFFFFMFIPNTLALEKDYIPDLGEEVKDTEISCSSSDYSKCNEFHPFYSQYFTSQSKWYRNVGLQPITPYGNSIYNSLGLERNKFQGPQPDGKFLLSYYIDSFSNYDIDNKTGYYQFNGKKDKFYRAYFVFSYNKEIQTYTQVEDIKWTFDLKSVLEDGSTSTTKDFTDNYNVGFLKFDSDFELSGEKYPYGYILFFEFKSKLDFNKFRFLLSSEEFYNVYMGNPSSSDNAKGYYNQFKFVTTNKLLLDDDTNLPDEIKNQIEKIYDDSEAISSQDGLFDNLKKCDAVDIGCHFDNLWTVLKGIFDRIGLFFKSILNNIALMWKTFIDSKIIGIDVFLEQLNNVITNDTSLSSIITRPLEMIKSLPNSVCTNVSLNLPIINNTVKLPCMTPLYQQYFGAVFNLYQLITNGLIAYFVLINLLSFLFEFKEPTSDKVEVVEL